MSAANARTSPPLDKLLRAVRDRDPEERFEAVGSLAYWWFPDPRALEAIVVASDDRVPRVARLAVRMAAEHGHPAARDLILKLLHRGQPSATRVALWSAWVVDISPHLEQAWKAIERPGWKGKWLGSGALAAGGAVEAAPRIREMAKAAQARRQMNYAPGLAAHAALLGDVEGKELFPALLTHPRNATARYEAASSLRRRGRPAAMARAVGEQQLRDALREVLRIYSAHPLRKDERLWHMSAVHARAVLKELGDEEPSPFPG